MVLKPGSAPIEDIIDRAHARLLHRVENGASAFEVLEDDRYRWLQNEDGTLQSLMDQRSPERLVLPYTRAMMAGLLFVDTPGTVLMLGLGGASQARFLRHHFADARITAWESNPQIIDIARRHFLVPVDSGSIRVFNEDARTNLPIDDPCADLILLDLFGAEGMPAWLRQKALYARYRRCLSKDGVLVSNLWVDANDEFLEVMDGIQKAFRKRTLVLGVPGYRNLVVLGFKSPPRLEFAYLQDRAVALGERTGIDYTKLLSRMLESNYSDETGFVF